MKAIWLWLSLGILLGLAVAPRTSWVVKNHAEYLLNDSQKAVWKNPGWPTEPKSLLRPESWTVDTPYRPLFQGQVTPVALAEDFEQVKRMDRPEIGCGILLRRFARQEPVDAFRPTLLEIARFGQAAASDNAFFWTEEASHLSAIDPKASRQALLIASRKAEFDEYGHEEAQYAINLVESTFGFRGNYIRLMCSSGVAYPHWDRLLTLIPNYQPIGEKRPEVILPLNDPELRDALIRIADLLQRRSRSSIGILISNHVVSTALDLPPFRKDMGSLNAKLRERATKASHLAETVADRAIMIRSAPIDQEGSARIDALLDEPRGWFASSLILSMLVLALGAIGTHYLGGKLSKWPLATSNLALLAALPFFGQHGQTTLAIGAALATLAGLGRHWIGVLIALISFVAACSAETQLPVAPLSIVFLGLACSKWGRTPWAVSIVVAGVAFGVSAVIKPVELITLPLFPIWLLLSGIVVTLLSARSTPKPLEFGPVFAILVVAYAGVVAKELSADILIGRARHEFITSADRYRASCGLPPIWDEKSP